MKTLEELELKDVSQIYKGKDNHCRCGCGGRYIATTFMEKSRSEVNDELAQKWLDAAKRMNAKHQNAEQAAICINVPIGNNRCYCIYIDELKKES